MVVDAEYEKNNLDTSKIVEACAHGLTVYAAHHQEGLPVCFQSKESQCQTLWNPIKD